jgi:hypothetical protein
VSRDHIEYFADQPFKLGAWVAIRRRERVENVLSAERISSLNKLGFVWDPAETAFQEGVKALRNFVERENHSKVPQRHQETVDNQVINLGTWLHRHRRDKIKGILSNERIAVLNELGVDWDPLETSFQEGLIALRQYVGREGNARVPKNQKETIANKVFNLGMWAANRRANRNNDQLSEEHFDALEALGFDWDPYETDFQEGLTALRQYFEREGHGRVPQNHKERVDGQPFKLGSWVSNKRVQRNSGKLNDKRVSALDSLGFDWNTYQTGFEDGLRALRQYIEREGNGRVPPSHIEYFGDRAFSLGKWVSHRRYDRKKGKLSGSQLTSLDEVGFDWGDG